MVVVASRQAYVHAQVVCQRQQGVGRSIGRVRRAGRSGNRRVAAAVMTLVVMATSHRAFGHDFAIFVLRRGKQRRAALNGDLGHIWKLS